MVLPQSISLRGNYAVIYTDRSVLLNNSRRKLMPLNFANTKTYSGGVTRHVAKRIRKAVHCLVQCTENKTVYNTVTKRNQKFHLNFITLTIPDTTTLDASCYYKILLKPFLRSMKNVAGLKNYIWKAELQKRGSIHYHLTTDCFIDLSIIRNKWNQLLAVNGLMSAYQQEFGNSNPNSIDVHSVRKIKNFEAYLTKYIAKDNEGEIKLKGKIWGCSESLQNAKYSATWVDEGTDCQLRNAQKANKITVITGEQCAVVKLNKGVSWFEVCPEVYNAWLHWKQTALNQYAGVPPGASLTPQLPSISPSHQKIGTVLEYKIDLFN